MTCFHLIDGLAAPISPSSHAAEAGGFLFLTGQIGRNLHDPDEPLPDGVLAQTNAALENIRTVLGGLGLGIADIVSVRVYLTDFARDYDVMNAGYQAFFGASRPSRTCIGVTDLARGALIEIDCIAARPCVSAPPAEVRP